MSNDNNDPHIDRELDLSNTGRGVWLEKVPKCIANKWDTASGHIEVGKLKITRVPGQKAQVQLTLSEAVMCLKDHKLKYESIKKALMTQRKVQQLAKVVPKFKPISVHRHDIEYSLKKKAEGKKMRDNKDVVLNMLFAAYEKYQYYNIKDLHRITKQPMEYLKEILKEVCNYNTKNPHKSMWELKPKYRHYKQEVSVDSDGTKVTYLFCFAKKTNSIVTKLVWD